DPAVSQGDVQKCALKGRHRDLVEHRLRCQRRELGEQLKARRVSQKPGPHLLYRPDSLPRHGHTHLKHTHELLRQRHVPREEDPDAGITSSSEHFSNLRRHDGTLTNLSEDPDLHVVDDERQAMRVAHLVETLRYLQSIGSLHHVTSLILTGSFGSGPSPRIEQLA